MERRLAAILAADVVGYSRIMERDEAGTLAGLKHRRREQSSNLFWPGSRLALVGRATQHRAELSLQRCESLLPTRKVQSPLRERVHRRAQSVSTDASSPVHPPPVDGDRYPERYPGVR